MNKKFFTKLLSIALVCVMMIMCMGAAGVNANNVNGNEVHWINNNSKLKEYFFENKTSSYAKNQSEIQVCDFIDIININQTNVEISYIAKFSLNGNKIIFEKTAKLNLNTINNKKFASGKIDGELLINEQKYDVLINIDISIESLDSFSTLTIQPVNAQDPDDCVFLWLGNQVLTEDEFNLIYGVIEDSEQATIAQSENLIESISDAFVESGKRSTTYGEIAIWNNSNEVAFVSLKSKTAALYNYYMNLYGLSSSSKVDVIELRLETVDRYGPAYIVNFNSLSPTYKDYDELKSFALALSGALSMLGITGQAVAGISSLMIEFLWVPGIASTDFGSGSSATEAFARHDYAIGNTISFDVEPMLQDFKLATSKSGSYAFRAIGKIEYISYINSQGTPHPSIQRYNHSINSYTTNINLK